MSETNLPPTELPLSPNNSDQLFQRIAELINPKIFAGKTVVVLGVGSGGSHIIRELTKCGVSDIILVDKDTLSIANVIRHICGLRDIGRPKTSAVQDYLHNINPMAKITCHNIDIMADEIALENIISQASLVIAGTDNEPSRFRINRICWKYKVAALYAYAFHRAFYGETFLSIPDKTPCYACFSSRLGHIEPEEEQKALNYDDPELTNLERSMPGLGMDVSMIALLASKLGLIYLLQNTPYQMPFPPGNCIRWKNRPLDGEISNAYFDRQFWDIQRYPGCLVCNNTTPQQKLLDEFDKIITSL